MATPITSKQIIETPIETLRPFPKNPRTWDDVDERNLTESIQKFGILLPLLVNNAKGREGIVIGGNFRLSIYKKLGIQMVPVIYVSIEDEEKERELNIRLNLNQGNWDWELLKEYKIDDLLSYGFNEINLGKFWDSELAIENDHFDLKKAKEEVLKNPVSKIGDLFQLGNHRVICGSSTDLEVVKRLVGDNPTHYINSDPPFNIGLNYSKGVGNNGNYGGQEKDKRSEDEYKQFLKTSIENALSVSQPDTHVFYWSDETRVGILQQIYKELGIENKRLCIWIKNNQSVTPKIAFNKMTEFCVYGVKGKPYLNENLRNLNEIQNKEIASGNRSADDIYDLLNIWLIDRLPATEYVHPTMKNPTLYEKALRRCTQIGNYVLDLFAGSGSQLIASEQLKRRALLVELDPVFVDIILLRYEQFTSDKPIKLS
ncbi:MAG: DNA modification methylase [Candidatus Levybacteria bacterium]|nr:DNA modification methylase [Candidatus Levybacteria bacterium]